MLQYPKDADDIWVPLDTTAMYRKNGNQFHVSDFFYEAKADEYCAIAMCDDILNRIRNLRGETHDC